MALVLSLWTGTPKRGKHPAKARENALIGENGVPHSYVARRAAHNGQGFAEILECSTRGRSPTAGHGKDQLVGP